MLASIKSGEAAARRDLRYQLIAERLSGTPQDSDYVNAAMEWGIAHESEAVSAYESSTGVMVDRIGFCEHETLLAGTSPDGFIGSDGILSVKCPKTATMIRYLRERTEPSEHWAQNTHELWLTGRAWLDFVSYDPRLPEGLQLFALRVTRTPSELASYELALSLFLSEVQRGVEDVRKLMLVPV
jgi:hypothetical protein